MSEIKNIYKEITNANFVQGIKKVFIHQKFLFVVVIIVLIVLINSDIWTTIDGLITTGTLLAVIYNVYINAKNNEAQLHKIPIYFNNRKLNLDIARKDFSRSEIQGILGILRVDMNTPYDIAYLSKIEYLDKIYSIQKSELHELKIEITTDELKQFKNDIYETNHNNQR